MAYTSITRATLRARLQDRYDDQPFWSDTEANDALNETLRQFNYYTGYWRGSATIVTNPGDRFLTLSATLTKQTRVYRSGRPLWRKSLTELYQQRPSWRTQATGDGSPVPSTIREWAPIGVSALAIWPADTAGGTTLTTDGVKVTPVLTADGQFLDLGDEELTILLDEALWVLGFKRPSLLEALRPRHQRFLEGCLLKNDLLRASAFYRRSLGLDQQQRLLPIRTAQDTDRTPSIAGLGS